MSLAPGQPMSPDAKSPPDNPMASDGSGAAVQATSTPANAPGEAQFPPDVEAQRAAPAATEDHVEATSDVETEPPAVNARAKPKTKRVFGLQRQYRTHAAAGNDPHNYEQKYPPDEIGEELGPNACV
ncbi:hypothetical protein EWM64_g3951 [Hericium alpestre]|uniref:Uncharacterized protein n=1 Tax=Hericium alpestre TaxID=135208 RepID=A0A4Z0A174_9AGAM|nr:hypothetical protein EWM64_g3951 [Hericium alpestre]